jgi:hypothetical protein
LSPTSFHRTAGMCDLFPGTSWFCDFASMRFVVG